MAKFILKVFNNEKQLDDFEVIDEIEEEMKIAMKETMEEIKKKLLTIEELVK